MDVKEFSETYPFAVAPFLRKGDTIIATEIHEMTDLGLENQAFCINTEYGEWYSTTAHWIYAYADGGLYSIDQVHPEFYRLSGNMVKLQEPWRGHPQHETVQDMIDRLASLPRYIVTADVVRLSRYHTDGFKSPQNNSLIWLNLYINDTPKHPKVGWAPVDDNCDMYIYQDREASIHCSVIEDNDGNWCAFCHRRSGDDVVGEYFPDHSGTGALDAAMRDAEGWLAEQYAICKLLTAIFTEKDEEPLKLQWLNPIGTYWKWVLYPESLDSIRPVTVEIARDVDRTYSVHGDYEIGGRHLEPPSRRLVADSLATLDEAKAIAENWAMTMLDIIIDAASDVLG